MLDFLKKILNKNKITEIDFEKRQYTDWSISNIVNNQTKYNGFGEKIAVLDTGIDASHKDLIGNVSCYDFTHSDKYEDNNGHGTFCASLICARDNNFGLLGVAPNSHVFGCKVLHGNHLDTDILEYEKRIIDALLFCVEQNIKIVSISLGTKTYNSDLDNAIQMAIDMGILIFAAYGNSGFSGEPECLYPANYNRVISVTSANSKNFPFWFTSFAENNDFVHYPDVAISSQQFYIGCLPFNKYGKMNGTSMATPVMAGVASLWRQWMQETVGLPSDGTCYDMFMHWLQNNTIEKHQTRDKYLGFGVFQLNADSFKQPLVLV